MKFRMILSALLLPTVVLAQQASVKQGQSSTPYRVVAIQGPVASAAPDTDLPAYDPQAGESVKVADGTQNGESVKAANGVQVGENARVANGVQAGGVVKVKDGDGVSLVYGLKPQDRAVLLQNGIQPQGYSLLLPNGTQNDSLTTLFAPGAQSKVRVNLNLRNAPLKEAVKQLSEQTKLEFVLDSDVPADARVTIVAKNIRLSTALDMLTDATDMKWGRKTVKKPDSKEAETVYQIGKNVPQPFLQWSNDSFLNNFMSKDGKPLPWSTSDKNFRLFYQELLDKDGKPKYNLTSPQYKVVPGPNGSLKLNPNLNYNQIQNQVLPLIQSQRIGSTFNTKPNNLSSTYSLGNTLVTAQSLAETHSTFTCPHCKAQVTVIHQHQAPKCDTCGRAFHDDWQFCPFDGAKRPAIASNDWQFCPICGKSLKPDGKTETKPEAKGAAKADAKPEPKP